ncbi:MAG: phytanoyl-CoA dioxygenase family protein [Myxococcota bacterium]
MDTTRITELLQKARDPGYWARLNPHLTIEGRRHRAPRGPAVPQKILRQAAEQMHEQGWCQLDKAVGTADLKVLRSAIASVKRAGWLSAFAFVYDELWLASRIPAVAQLAEAILGPGYRLIPDFWAYFIDVNDRAHGYRPHREVTTNTLMPDGCPASITIWLPITDATLDNGCMYVIPTHLELHRFDESELRRIYGPQYEPLALLHRARALPARAGAALSWNHFARHWGSFSSSSAHEPRMSVAFEFMRGDVDPAFHPHTHFWEELKPRQPMVMAPDDELPSLANRLYLLGRQIRRYWQPNDPADVFPALGNELMREGFPWRWQKRQPFRVS